MTNVAPFKNQHLSYSRLSRFETCPLSYRLHYIEKKQAESGLPLRFGKTIHAVLEPLPAGLPPWELRLIEAALTKLPDDEETDDAPTR